MSYRLNLLGSLDLKDSSGTSINAVLQQPRRLALLIYLALADRDKSVKRDTLLGLFWPDATQDSGRRALSQAIHFLRKSLGSNAILSRGNEDVSLNFDVVDCDAARFLAAAKAGDLETAAAHYAGDLLPGFFATASPEFDQWLDGEREQFRRSAAEVFWSAAEEARSRGQIVSAAASARRAAELATDSESATRRLIEFLDSIDDRAGALDVYENLVRRLQTDYETMPSAKTRDLAARIRRDGAAVEAERLGKDPSVARLRTLPWLEIRQHGRTVTGATILMFAFVSLWGLTRGKADGVRTDASLAIETPEVFDASLRDEAAEILSDAAAALVAVPNLTVRDETASNAAEVGAHFVLRPKFTQREGRLRVTASLVDLETNTLVRSASFDVEGNDKDALESVALDMSEFARQAMGRHIRAMAVERVKGPNADVLSQAMLARLRADSLVQQGLSDFALLTLERADAELVNALETSRDAALHVKRAELAYDRAWAFVVPPLADNKKMSDAINAGIKAADLAMKSEPRNADAHELRGLLSYMSWLMSAPQHAGAPIIRADAETSLRKAVELNPNAARAWSALATILLAKGEYTLAYWAAEKGLAADTYFDLGDALTASLFAAGVEVGDRQAAAKWCAHIARRKPAGGSAAMCELQLIATANQVKPEDLRRGDEIIARVASDQTGIFWVPLAKPVLAVAYAKAGDHSKANALLVSDDNGPLSGEARPYKAWAMNQMGNRKEAKALLTRYVAENPSVRSGVTRSARYSGLY